MIYTPSVPSRLNSRNTARRIEQPPFFQASIDYPDFVWIESTVSNGRVISPDFELLVRYTSWNGMGNRIGEALSVPQISFCCENVKSSFFRCSSTRRLNGIRDDLSIKWIRRQEATRQLASCFFFNGLIFFRNWEGCHSSLLDSTWMIHFSDIANILVSSIHCESKIGRKHIAREDIAKRYTYFIWR